MRITPVVMEGGQGLDIRVNEVAIVTSKLSTWMIAATVRSRGHTKKVNFCQDVNVVYELQLINAYF